MTEKQQEIYDLFKDGIKKSIASYPVLRGAIAIRTPYQGFAGDDLEIFVTQEGKVTDGGATLNLFESLRCYQDFLDWPFKADFFRDYNMVILDREIVCTDCSPGGLVRYAQGMSRLQNMFEAHPIK